MLLLTTFLRDRRGVGAIDYCFVAALMIGVRDLAEGYGAAAGIAIKQAFALA